MSPWFASFAERLFTGGRRHFDLEEDRPSSKTPIFKNPAMAQRQAFPLSLSSIESLQDRMNES
jgi:hypothetical protein